VTFPLLALCTFGIAIAALALARYARQELAAAVAGSGAILLLHGRFYFHYTSDDAYISFRYARNFADGIGLVWNSGEHVEGYTNFLWVLVLAGLDRAGADMVISARWLGFGLAVLAAVGTYLLARDLLEGAAGRMAGVVAALLLAASGTWALWALAGLEPPLFAVLALAAVLSHLRERDGRFPPLSGVAWGLAAMTRPDAGLLILVSGVFKLGDLVAPHDGEGRIPWRRLAHLVLWVAVFAVTFAPYFVWRYDTYGWLFPNTYYAKVGTGSAQYERGLAYLMSFAEEYAAWLAVIVPLAAALTSERRNPRLYVLALVLAWFGDTVYVGGDSLLRFRLFAPVLPLFYAVVVASGAALLQAVYSQGAPGRWLRDGAIALAAVALVLFTLEPTANGFGVDARKGETKAGGERTEVGRWMRANLPQSTVIAVIPAGIIPYEARLPTIDMLGLSDEHIAHRRLKLGLFPAGHEKYDTDYVLDRRPDIIVLYDGLTDLPWHIADYAKLRSTLIPAVVDMVASPRPPEEYDYRYVQISEGKWLNLLVRPGNAAVEALTQPAAP
jgi:hypothetical protein